MKNDYDDVIDNIKEPNQVEDKREIQLDIPCGALKSHIDKHGDIFERQRSSIEIRKPIFSKLKYFNV